MKRSVLLLIGIAAVIVLLPIYADSQNVGIGNPNPKAKLDVYGNIKIGTDSADALMGTIRYLSTEFEGYNGTSWIPLHTLWTKYGIGTTIYRPTGSVGVGWSNPSGKLGVSADGSEDNIVLRKTAPGNYIKCYDSQDSLWPFLISMDRNAFNDSYARLSISNTWPNQLTIHKNGRLGFGTDAPGSRPGLESTLIEFADNDPLHSDWTLWVATELYYGYPAVLFAKSRGTITDPLPVTNNHMLGGFLFLGWDGVSFVRSAEIRSEVDGNPGVDNVLGRLMFYTRTTGTNNPTERMRITNLGYVGIGTQSPTGTLHVNGGTSTTGSGSPITLQAQNGRASGNTNGGDIFILPGTPFGSGRDGRVGINTSTPSEVLAVNGRITLEQTSAPSTTTNKLYNVGGALYWAGSPVGGGGGSVSSVGLSLPYQFNVSGSPVTSSGTLTATWNNVSANQFLAGPTTGSAAPAFRQIDASDIPYHTQDYYSITGTPTTLAGYGITDAVPNWRSISTTSPLQGGGNLSSDLTISIPLATSSASGYLGSWDWTTFNNKVPPYRYITALSPLQGSGDLSADLTISISQANGSTSGYISSTDWNTFNNKVSTTRTISTTSPLQGGGDLSANRTFSIALANGSTSGYLSSTDWNTFNDKLSSSRSLTINGTSNQVGVTGGTQNLTADRTWTVALANNVVLPGNASLTTPIGTTAQRPGTPVNGMIRYNSSTNAFEAYQAGAWVGFGGGTSGTLSGTTVYTSGSGTYTVPSGVTVIVVELVGGGGGGSGGSATSNGHCVAGGGGGGGGYTRSRIATSPGSTFSYSVGTGGSGQSTSNGSSGNNTTFSTLTAYAGQGGETMPSGSSALIDAGGDGGTASGGDLNVTGSAGGHGIRLNGTRGSSGSGGSSVLGGESAGRVVPTNTYTDGSNGSPYGGGGSGGAAHRGSSSNKTATGGDGGNGVIIITEFK